MNKWISVDDYLPPLKDDRMSDMVLVFKNDGKYDLGFATDTNRLKVEMLTSSWGEFPAQPVYWMPLPDAPQESV